MQLEDTIYNNLDNNKFLKSAIFDLNKDSFFLYIDPNFFVGKMKHISDMFYVLRKCNEILKKKDYYSINIGKITDKKKHLKRVELRIYFDNTYKIYLKKYASIKYKRKLETVDTKFIERLSDALDFTGIDLEKLQKMSNHQRSVKNVKNFNL